MQSYQLINPMIEGSFIDTYDAEEQLEASKKMWMNLSKHIVGYVPRFLFTMKNISTSNLHHFEVTESGSNQKYSIKELDLNIDKSVFDDFLKNVDNANKNKKGGSRKLNRKRYSSSSSSSSDSYPIIRRTDPIAIFNYMPRVYFAPGRTVIETPVSTTLNPTIGTVITPIYTPVFAHMSPFIALW